jgi:hypothetical protein
MLLVEVFDEIQSVCMMADSVVVVVCRARGSAWWILPFTAFAVRGSIADGLGHS